MSYLQKIRRPMSSVAAIAALALCITAATTATAHAAAPGQPRQVKAWATYYGWYDNTPPGCGTAYSGCAGGTGTYADPITFASDKAEFPVGTVLYYPTVRKYFVMGDECQECTKDWSGMGPDGGPHLYHVDLWIGGEGGNEFASINCEDALTQQKSDGDPKLTTFIVDPPSDLPVSSQPLFNTTTGACYGGATSSATIGTYQNQGTGLCLGQRYAEPGAPARAIPCDAETQDVQITFDGAFFTDQNLCLKTKYSGSVMPLVWWPCLGGPREQWETDANGTIDWVQYTRCIADENRVLVLTKCTQAADERWSFTAAP